MPDRISIMLDTMIFAVDNGHSFDGVVSIPEVGLEDYGRRPGLAGLLDDSVERFRATKQRVRAFWTKKRNTSGTSGILFKREESSIPHISERRIQEGEGVGPHARGHGTTPNVAMEPPRREESRSSQGLPTDRGRLQGGDGVEGQHPSPTPDVLLEVRLPRGREEPESSQAFGIGERGSASDPERLPRRRALQSVHREQGAS